MKFIIQYKNQYIKVEANEKYFHIDKSYRFTSIKNMKNKSYLLTESNREELKIEFINKIDDFVVNQYYINCVTENGTIGYPIHYCPICGEKLK